MRALILITLLAAVNGCTNVVMQLSTDDYPGDNSWEIKQGSKVVASAGNFADRWTLYTNTVCLNNGDYDWVISDTAGDGIRPGGWVGIDIAGHRRYLEGGGHIGGFRTKTWKFKVGFSPSMTSRQTQWLDAHNSRRRTWHGQLGKIYRPLKWSPALQASAQSWANTLASRSSVASGCSLDQSSHASTAEGENLAANGGSGDWGAIKTPDSIVGRWVEFEQTWNWNANSHLTQALWWSTGYLGCGESNTTMSNGNPCQIQVCRYVRPGNCDVNSNGDPQARAAMMKEDLDSSCQPLWPAEGIF